MKENKYCLWCDKTTTHEYKDTLNCLTVKCLKCSSTIIEK